VEVNARRAAATLLLAVLVTAVAFPGAPLPATDAEAAPRRGIRPAVVAGSFYPDDPQRLRNAVAGYLAGAVPRREARPLGLLVPHAGYVYSGQIAADAWRQAADRDYDVVVVLGTNHSSPPFDGVSVYDGRAYATPLGEVPIDRAIVEALRAADPLFVFRPDAHRREHSVEVQVPFLQTVLPGVPMVGMIVGRNDLDLCRRAGRVLADVLRHRRALLVASSDLSHYPPHATAVAADRKTLAALVGLDPARFRQVVVGQERSDLPGLSTCACGSAPIMTLLAAARRLGAGHLAVLSCANSGDTSLGDRDRCVGYGAVAFYGGEGEDDLSALQPPPAAPAGAMLDEPARRWLLRFARETIRRYLETGTTPLARGYPPVLGRSQGAFVTLETGGHRLRGCIGHIVGDTPLAVTVGQMALQAAFHDPRFPPLRRSELERITIEISVLTPPRRVPGAEAIVVGRDGVILHKDGRSAVYLPQVAVEQGWNRAQMLSHLAQKAGLPPDGWRRGAWFETFQAEVFRE